MMTPLGFRSHCRHPFVRIDKWLYITLVTLRLIATDFAESTVICRLLQYYFDVVSHLVNYTLLFILWNVEPHADVQGGQHAFNPAELAVVEI